MKYLSVKQTAEKWNISPTMVRRYCLQGRIPNAILDEAGWKIPVKAKKPKGVNEPPGRDIEISPLAKKLIRQKKKRSYHGLYDYVQINLTYSSCRMASNRLTRKQVEMIFKKGKVEDTFEAVKVSDTIEAMNHCVCVDYIIDHIADQLSMKLIKKLHYLLMSGTVDERQERVIPGEFRTERSFRKERFFVRADQIAKDLQELLSEYEHQNQHSLENILDLHVRFETIFPFEDGNGRIGRLLMFKECLRHSVTPFILDDKRRGKYLEGIRRWHEDREILLETAMETQGRFEAQETLQDLQEHGQRFLPSGYIMDE